MDLTASFKRLVRAALGGDPMRETPALDRLAHYRARVVACASDGSTLDVQADDPRVGAMQGVRVVTGLPAVSAVVVAGSVVWIGWEGGDPSSPRAVPAWEAATVTKLVIKAQAIYLGEEAGAEALVTVSEFNAHTHGVSGVQGGAATVTSATPVPATGTTTTRAK
jgi:hypothetical protein